ncbi:MAG: nuclease-related domain-containing protein [Oscillospiraceae bacterium]
MIYWIISGIAVLITLTIVSAVLIIKNKNKVIEVKPNEQITKSQIKGQIGEENTVREFNKFFESISADFKVLRNIYLKFDNENTTEIDIIIISEYGIYVIENKHYRGWIFGSFKQEQWTDSYPNGVKVRFYNPLKQNYTHIRTLKKYIDEKYHGMIYSYIVFSGECELKKVPYNSEFIKIIKSEDVFNTLKENIKDKVLISDEIELLYNKLNEFSNVSEDEKIKHIERIKVK